PHTGFETRFLASKPGFFHAPGGSETRFPEQKPGFKIRGTPIPPAARRRSSHHQLHTLCLRERWRGIIPATHLSGDITSRTLRGTVMARTAISETRPESVTVTAGGVVLEGDLGIPDGASGVVLFAHGSGSGRHSPRNQFVAARLHAAGLATLLIDLL